MPYRKDGNGGERWWYRRAVKRTDVILFEISEMGTARVFARSRGLQPCERVTLGVAGRWGDATLLANLIDAGDVKLSWGVSYREVWHEGISDALRLRLESTHFCCVFRIGSSTVTPFLLVT